MFRKHPGSDPPHTHTPMGPVLGMSYCHWGTLLLSCKLPSIVRKHHVTWDTSFPVLALNSAMHPAEVQTLVPVKMRLVKRECSHVRRGGH